MASLEYPPPLRKGANQTTAWCTDVGAWDATMAATNAIDNAHAAHPALLIVTFCKLKRS